VNGRGINRTEARRPAAVLPSVSGIYAIVHLATGRRYVGSAVNMRERTGVHRCMLRAGKHINARLQRAWNKYGEGAFSFEVLEEHQREQLLVAEQRHIDKKSEFNILPKAGSHLGAKRTLAARARLREKQLGVFPTAETRAKMRASRKASPKVAAVFAAMVGRGLSPEVRAKISKSVKRAMASPELRSRLSESLKTSAKAAEARARIADRQRGQPLTSAHRAKIGAAMATSEVRARISAAQTGVPWSASRRASHEASKACGN